MPSHDAMPPQATQTSPSSSASPQSSPSSILAISVRSTITIIPIVVFTRQSIVINRSASREPASVARATSNSTPAMPNQHKICVHGKQLRICRLCKSGGGAFCIHGVQRSRCQKCGRKLEMKSTGSLRLSEKEFCQSELLTHPGFRGVVESSTLRILMKRALTSRGITDQAACISVATTKPVWLGIIYEVAEGAQQGRGPRVKRFAKRSWNEIESNTVSMEHLEKLAVSRDSFP